MRSPSLVKRPMRSLVRPMRSPSLVRPMRSPSLVKRRRRRRIAYIASAADVKPVVDAPDADFVFLTPEPAHEEARRCWNEGCRGHRWFVEGGAPLFTDVIHGCLGREEWTLAQRGDKVVYTNKSSGQTVRVFMNMSVSDHSKEAARAVAGCDSYIHHGWYPTDPLVERDLKRLVSGLRYADELEITGYYQPADGLDAEVEVGSEWVFVKHESELSEPESDWC